MSVSLPRELNVRRWAIRFGWPTLNFQAMGVKRSYLCDAQNFLRFLVANGTH
jgi:hypothetical protein